MIEPVLYGHSIGISQTALLVAVAFWTWLWGPIGLILATPLTADVAYYQRLIAMDRDEAAEIVEAELSRGAPRIYDEVMLPALNYARRDRERDELTDEQLDFVARVSRELVDELVAPATEAVSEARGRILGCPGQDELDSVALHMLADVLAAAGVLASEIVAQVEDARPSCICVAALPPGGLAHTRYLLKRLRARVTGVCVVVGRWGVTVGPLEDPAPLVAAGADRVATTLAATRDHILELMPLLAAPAAPEPMRRTA